MPLPKRFGWMSEQMRAHTPVVDLNQLREWVWSSVVATPFSSETVKTVIVRDVAGMLMRFWAAPGPGSQTYSFMT